MSSLSRVARRSFDSPGVSVTNWASAAKRAVSSIRSTTTFCCWAPATLTARGTPSASSTAAIRMMSSGRRRVRTRPRYEPGATSR
ncbi:hypothetical protein SALBM311S_00341 [Streptomyces alboniger]